MNCNGIDIAPDVLLSGAIDQVMQTRVAAAALKCRNHGASEQSTASCHVAPAHTTKRNGLLQRLGQEKDNEPTVY